MSISAAWGGTPPRDETEARERLLDAASRCMASRGIPKTTLSAIAAEAGVTRPTIYRYFDGRDHVVGQALTRAGLGLAAELGEKFTGVKDPAEILVGALAYTVRRIRADPVMSQMISLDAPDPFFLENFAGPKAVDVCAELLRPLREMMPPISDEEMREMAEFILRVMLSLLVATEPERSEGDMQAFLRRRLLPSLGLA